MTSPETLTRRATLPRTPVGRDDDDRSWGIFLAVAAPIALGALLVPFRSEISGTNAALTFVIPVVVAAYVGGRLSGALSAIVGAASFDFFMTRPYLSLNIESRADVETAALLGVVGLIVGTIAAQSHRSHTTTSALDTEVRGVHRIAELVASGRHAEVAVAASEELERMLGLQDCRFEVAPFGHEYPTLDRRGSTGGLLPSYVATKSGLELPTDGVELPVVADGETVARFVLTPTPGVGVTTHARLAAVIIADYVGTSLRYL